MTRNAFLDRRRFLQWGALGGVLGAAGCSGGDGSSQEVTTPPVGGGNRTVLQKNADAGKAAAETSKSKRKKR
jgi:hypothetical protein